MTSTLFIDVYRWIFLFVCAKIRPQNQSRQTFCTEESIFNDFNNMSAPSVAVTSFLKARKSTPPGFPRFLMFFHVLPKRGLVSGSNPRGTEHLPTVTKGYFVTAEEPLEVGMDGMDVWFSRMRREWFSSNSGGLEVGVVCHPALQRSDCKRPQGARD